MREYLRTMRGEKSMTQEEIAKRMGIEQHSYSNIENGNRQRDMSISTAEKLASALGVPPEHIIEMEREYQKTIGA